MTWLNFVKKYSFLLWMLFILILCLMPSNPNRPKRFEWIPDNADKMVHFGLYFILAFLFLKSFLLRKVNLPKAFFLSLILSIVYGLIIEILQESFTQTRHFEWYDLLANALGALGGCILMAWHKQKILS